MLLLAAPHLAHPKAADCVALLSNGRQGVRIAAGTWHHGLLALDHGPWAVLERRGETVHCDELVLDVPLTLTVEDAAGKRSNVDVQAQVRALAPAHGKSPHAH